MINTDADQISFADSDQFDDDSVNSWLSDSGDQINNWRGWKKVCSNSNQQISTINCETKLNQPEKLLNQAAKVVAAIQPGFDLTEKGVPFPEELIKLIAFYSFPSSEEEIRLYSCLGCGNIDEFIRGENLYKTKAVHDCLQIGFHLSAKVSRRTLNTQQQSSGDSLHPQYDGRYDAFGSYLNRNTEFNVNVSSNANNCVKQQITNVASMYNNIFKVGVTFDRGKITSCHCSCDFLDCVDKVWCSHVVAACLYRIHEAKNVQIRAPISESLSKLSKEDLQKFAQFLISKMNLADILPAAQNILDELLASTCNPMKSVRGAPDLTAGASFEDLSMWFFDHSYIQGNISKILQKFCVPKPVVYGDPRHLSNNLPLLAQEYQNILRPMRGKEPESIWNLISIIRDMFRREDRNALSLLRILTKCLLDSELIMMWWYCVKLNQDSCIKSNSQSNNYLHSPYASSYFCDEMVQLWRIAALRYSLQTCSFVTRRRLQVHRSELFNETVNDLMEEIKSIHKSVIRTAIICLEKPPSRTLLNNSNNNINNNNNGNRNSSLTSNNVTNINSFNKELSITDEEVQKYFVGFKSAIQACRMCIKMMDLNGEKYKKNQLRKISPKNEFSNVDSQDLKNAEIFNNYSESFIDDIYVKGDKCENKYFQSSSRKFEDEEYEFHTKSKDIGTFIFDNSNKSFDETSWKYAKCEALYYHGYPNEAAQLAYELAEAMLEQKMELCEKYYLLARMSLIQKVNEYQKLNEVNQSNHSFGNCHQSQNVLQQSQTQQQSHHSKIHFSSGNKIVRRYRGSGTHNSSSNNVLNPITYNCGSKSVEYHIETDEVYESKTLMKRMQFLITCLVNESIDWSKVAPPQQHLIPSKSRLIEVAFHLLIFALQLPRPPAPYRHLEVNMIQLEIDLVVQAQHVKWRDYIPNFRSLLTDIALQLKNRTLLYFTEIYVPYNLALFIFEQLIGINGNIVVDNNFSSVGNNAKNRQRLYSRDKLKTRTSQNENLEMFSCSSDDFQNDTSFDSNLRFESALSVLGMKSKMPERINPLLVEGQRRLRDEFAAFLFNVYKDDVEKLTMILNQLLDPVLNPQFKAAPLKFYLSNSLNKLIGSLENSEATFNLQDYSSNHNSPTKSPDKIEIYEESIKTIENMSITLKSSNDHSLTKTDFITVEPTYLTETVSCGTKYTTANLYSVPSSQKSDKVIKLHSPQCKLTKSRNEKPIQFIDTDSSALEDDNSETSITDKKIWEQKLRCLTTSKRVLNQHSTGMAAVDSSAPETTESSDNSPTTIRKRIFPINQQLSLYKIITDGIPCGGEQVNDTQTDSNDIVTTEVEPCTKIPVDISLEKVGEMLIAPSQSSVSASISASSSPQNLSSSPFQCDNNISNDSTTQSNNLNKKNSESNIKNDHDCFIDKIIDYVEIVTESLAHHMFELAQTVLQKAGIPDDSSTPVFRMNSNNTMSSAIHSSIQNSGPSTSNHLAQRNLQLCAFQLGLYALGLYNHLNPLWQSRTYSSHVAWISTQIVDFGLAAACVLLHSWRHHLNPSEVAEIAYRVSKRRDSQMSRVGTELCLAVLAESSTLNPDQILRGLRQCSDQSSEMLERGLLSVESGANNSLSGVQPIIYFHLAQAWYQLYKGEEGQNSFHHSTNVVSSSSTPVSQALLSTMPSLTVSNLSSLSHSYQQSFNTSTNGQFPTNLIPAIPQFINPHNISNLMSQAAQISVGAFPSNTYGSSLPLVSHPTDTNHSWIYSNIITGQNPITPSHVFQSNLLYQSPYISHFQLMPLRGLPANMPSTSVNNVQSRPVYFYQPTSITQQLQQPHPGSTVLQSSQNLHQSTNSRIHTSYQSNYTNQSSGNFQNNGLFQPTYQLQTSDNRAYDYLLRAFNSAMKAIHILKQLHNSSNDSSDSSNNPSNTSNSNISRRQLLFNSSTSEINDYPSTSIAESQSHDTNIRWTIKLAKLLGPEEVNRYCLLISQFVQNPFLMKDIVMEVMDFYCMSQINTTISPDFGATVSNNSCQGSLIQNSLSNNHHNSGLMSGSRQQGMLLPMPANFSTIRTNQEFSFPSMPGIGLHHSPNAFNPNNHIHNSFNLPSIPISPTQAGIELVHKMVNRLHSLFRKLIDKRLQQTGQGPRDWDSLVELILDAYRAQRTLPATDPNLNWIEIMQKIKMNRKCTKDLWSRICAGLQTLDQI